MTDIRLRDAFQARFGRPHTHLCRAPGRVNLIGEHTDYNGLPVLPMALQRDVRIALRPRDDGRVRLQNLAQEFEPVEFEVGPGIPESPPGHWGNYAKAPADELARRFAIWKGMDGVVTSDVPVASGLSSSSALVNAVGLALAHINDAVTEPVKLAAVMADAERYTGTRGGGMDQAVSLGAREGYATRIRFAPLRFRHVPVPADWRFVVADTGVRVEKSGAAQGRYNRRRSECEEALEVVADRVVARGMASRRPRSYPELLRAILVDGALDVGEAALSGNLLKRYRHVVTEAGRVEAAVDAFIVADHMEFGMLMDASHGSLRSDFNVSSAELDELVALAKEGGAAGARLTGAGFGGCIVALASVGTVEGVMEAIRDGYHRYRGFPSEEMGDCVFVARPSGGATFLRVQPDD